MKIAQTMALAAAALGSAAVLADGHKQALDAALMQQPEAVQTRYAARNPAQTLEFFGIKPGMTVVEALPGGGWYSKILLSYLGDDGALIGADYAADMYPKFGFFDDAALEAKKTWSEDWTAQASEWETGSDADIAAFAFGSLPATMEGTADAVVLIRALHNLARFESDGGFLTQALHDAYSILKPGGVAGIVQHQVGEDVPDEWAQGNRGYLKESFVIEQMRKAGFEFVGRSDINANPKDQPGENDVVWRLPPTLATSRDNPELAAKMQAIGESNRMTLLFRKP